MLDTLIIDDNPQLARFAAAVLRLHGWRTRVATNGHIGLALAQEQVPDVIILDLQLPDLSGFDVLGWLRANPRTAAVPVLVWSGLDEEEGAPASQRHGAAAYLRKPVSADVLIAHVQQLTDDGASL